MFSSLSFQLRSNLLVKNSILQLIRFNTKKNTFNLGFYNNIKQNFSSVYVNHRDTLDNNQNTPFDFTEENYKEVEEILVKYFFNSKV